MQSTEMLTNSISGPNQTTTVTETEEVPEIHIIGLCLSSFITASQLNGLQHKMYTCSLHNVSTTSKHVADHKYLHHDLQV